MIHIYTCQSLIRSNHRLNPICLVLIQCLVYYRSIKQSNLKTKFIKPRTIPNFTWKNQKSRKDITDCIIWKKLRELRAQIVYMLKYFFSFASHKSSAFFETFPAINIPSYSSNHLPFRSHDFVR